MEITKELWEMLVASIADIKKDIHSLYEKIDGLDEKFAKKDCETTVNAIDKKVYAATAVISSVVVIMGLVIKFI